MKHQTTFCPKTYLNAKGRIKRRTYLGSNVILMLMTMAIVTVISMVFSGAAPTPAEGFSNGEQEGSIIGLILILAVTVVSIYISIVLQIKRLHDIGKTGWLCLLCFVPVINFLLILALLFIKGTEGPNNYGPDPLQTEAAPAAPEPI